MALWHYYGTMYTLELIIDKARKKLRLTYELLWSLLSTPTTTTDPNFSYSYFSDLSSLWMWSDLSMLGHFLIVLNLRNLNLIEPPTTNSIINNICH